MALAIVFVCKPVSGEAEGLELRVGDPAVLVELEGQFQRVAAGHGSDLAHAVRRLDRPDVPGIPEMIEHFVRIVPHIGNLLRRLQKGTHI